MHECCYSIRAFPLEGPNCWLCYTEVVYWLMCKVSPNKIYVTQSLLLGYFQSQTKQNWRSFISTFNTPFKDVSFRYTCVFACVCINCRAFRSLTMPCWKTDQYKCCDGCAVSNILGIVKQILDLVDSKTQYSSFKTGVKSKAGVMCNSNFKLLPV